MEISKGIQKHNVEEIYKTSQTALERCRRANNFSIKTKDVNQEKYTRNAVDKSKNFKLFHEFIGDKHS